MERPTRVHSRDQLLDAVWGMDKTIDLRTVDVHIRRLRKAINIPGTRDLIRTVRSGPWGLQQRAAQNLMTCCASRALGRRTSKSSTRWVFITLTRLQSGHPVKGTGWMTT